MKISVKYLVIFSLLILFGCKKSEEQKPADNNAKPATVAAKKKHGPAPPLPLEIYQEDKLVTTLKPADYPTVANAKVTVGDKEMDGVPLKDFLTKYNLKGKTLVLSGPQRSVAVTWEQATSKDVYLVVSGKQVVQISAPKTVDVNFPNRIIRIRASDKSQAAALAAEKPKAGH